VLCYTLFTNCLPNDRKKEKIQQGGMERSQKKLSKGIYEGLLKKS
jgi:hypothetical protein